MRPSYAEVSANDYQLELFVAMLIVITCLGLNILATIATLGATESRVIDEESKSGQKSADDDDFSSADAIRPFVLHVFVPIAISWLLSFIEVSVIISRIVSLSTENRRNSAIRNNLAIYSDADEEFNNSNVQHALNFNITYPASPKLSKSMNVSGGKETINSNL